MTRRVRVPILVVLWLAATAAAGAQGLEPAVTAAVGVRAGLRDPPALVVGLTVDLVRADALSLSIRPSLLVGPAVEVRACATLGVALGDRVRAYGGAGVAFNESGSGEVYPMLSGGVDLALLGRLGAQVHGNHLIEPGDTDAELMGSVSWQMLGPVPPYSP